ncbi:MAG: DUF2065 domain-containing protein [Rhodospirillales bacterium]
MLDELVTAFALVLVIEGVLYALLPDTMRRMMARMLAQPSSALRPAGAVAVAVGVALVWLVRG